MATTTLKPLGTFITGPGVEPKPILPLAPASQPAAAPSAPLAAPATQSPAPAPASTGSGYLGQYLIDSQASRPPVTDIGQRVTETLKNTAVPDISATVKSARELISQLPTSQRALAEAALNAFISQTQAAQQQQKIQAEALQTKAGATQGYIEGLRSLGPTVVAGAEASLAAWNKYTTTADQYLRDSASRMAAVTADIKGTIEQYAKTNDAALANSIQSASYTWLQTNKGTERGILERYGSDSAEYRDYLDAKRASVGAMVSDLTARSWDRTQQILNTGIGALAGAEVQLAEHVNLAQKNSLDALEASAAAGDQYRLDTSAFLLNLSAAENSAWSDLAEWIGSSSVTAVDATPLFSLLNELASSVKTMSMKDALNTRPKQLTVQHSGNIAENIGYGGYRF